MKTYAPRFPSAPRGGQIMMDAAAISSGLAFLTSELEKFDPLLREPLASVTYPRDIPIETGGGWIDTESAMNVGYGTSGGSGDAAFSGAGETLIRTIQADLSKDTFPTHPYEIAMRIKFIDMQRSDTIGRSIEEIYDTGIRLDFDKHMDQNTYLGFEKYGTTGLLNAPNVPTALTSTGASGSTQFATKTPDEILSDFNRAITKVWQTAEHDNSSIPNHILVPPQVYADMVSRKVGVTGDKSLLTYLEENNIAKKKGVDLIIAESMFCEGTGVGGTDRMILYRNEKRFLSEGILVPLSRIMTQANTSTVSYDSVYSANIGSVKIHYFQTIRYEDGI